MCKKKKIDQSLRKIIEPLYNPFSTCIAFIRIHERFSGSYESRSMRSRRFRGGSGCWQRDSRSCMEVEAVKGKIGERGWWERMRTLRKTGTEREGEEEGRCCWSWRFVDAGQRSGSSSRCLPSACYCLFKWPIRTASVTGIGATIAWKIAREIVERGKGGERKKKKNKEISSVETWAGEGKGRECVASDRSESSIRLDSPPSLLVPCYFIFRAINVIG